MEESGERIREEEREEKKSRRITRKRTRREMWSILLSGCWLKLAVRRWSTSLSGIASIISAKCSSSCSPDAPINEQFLMHSPGQCTRRTHNIIYVRSYGSFAYSYTYSRMQLRDLCMHLGIHAALCVMYLHATQRVTRACIMCTCLIMRIILRVQNVHYRPHHQFLTPTMWRRWVRMNDLQWPRFFVKSIAPLNVSPNDTTSSFIIVSRPIHRSLCVCFCYFFLRILHVVHCGEFSQLSLFIHVRTIGVFAGRLCLTELSTQGLSNVVVSYFMQGLVQ